MLGQIASVSEVEFDIEVALEEQRGIQPLPFPKMDSTYHYLLLYKQLYYSFIVTNIVNNC